MAYYEAESKAIKLLLYKVGNNRQKLQLIRQDKIASD